MKDNSASSLTLFHLLGYMSVCDLPHLFVLILLKSERVVCHLHKACEVENCLTFLCNSCSSIHTYCSGIHTYCSSIQYHLGSMFVLFCMVHSYIHRSMLEKGQSLRLQSKYRWVLDLLLDTLSLVCDDLVHFPLCLDSLDDAHCPQKNVSINQCTLYILCCMDNVHLFVMCENKMHILQSLTWHLHLFFILHE